MNSGRPEEDEVRGWLAASYAHFGDIEQAKSMLAQFLRIAQAEMDDAPAPQIGAWGAFWHAAIPYRHAEHFVHLYDGLRKAGMAD